MNIIKYVLEYIEIQKYKKAIYIYGSKNHACTLDFPFVKKADINRKKTKKKATLASWGLA